MENRISFAFNHADNHSNDNKKFCLWILQQNCWLTKLISRLRTLLRTCLDNG